MRLFCSNYRRAEMLIRNTSISYQLFLGIFIGLWVSVFLSQIFVLPFGHKNYNRNNEPSSMRSNDIAEKLEKEVRVLCWILTSPKNHKTKAIHVKRTWGRRCNRFIMMSTIQDDDVGTMALANVSEGRDWLWAKTKEAFTYIWHHHRGEADWFMKADDDTFVVVENLRKFLQTKSPREPVYFGCHFSIASRPTWASGGAGYILSKEALGRFVEIALRNPKKCRQDHGGAEDAELGVCLRSVGVNLGDSRDEWNRYRFVPLPPTALVVPKPKVLKFWYWKYIRYPQEQGLQSLANDAIGFHYVKPGELYLFEYLIYHLRPYGINKEVQYVPEYPLEFTDPTIKPAASANGSAYSIKDIIKLNETSMGASPPAASINNLMFASVNNTEKNQ